MYTYSIKRTVLIVFACLLLSVQLPAKSMKELWIAMPDSMLVYLSKSIREKSVNLGEMNLKTKVSNAFGDKFCVDTLSSDYISVSLSESSSLQMCMMPAASGDSVLCVVKTYDGPSRESMVEIYSQSWKKLADISFDISDFLNKPDTMLAAKYEELKKLFDPHVFSAIIFPKDNVLEVSVSAVNISKDEALALEGIIVRRKYRWNGKHFY